MSLERVKITCNLLKRSAFSNGRWKWIAPLNYKIHSFYSRHVKNRTKSLLVLIRSEIRLLRDMLISWRRRRKQERCLALEPLLAFFFLIWYVRVSSFHWCNVYHGSLNRREPVFILDLFLSKTIYLGVMARLLIRLNSACVSS